MPCVPLIRGRATVSHVDRPSAESPAQLSASRPVLVISYSFLDTNCATKLPLEIGIILELPSPLGWSRDCLCIDVYGSESSASCTNGPAARTAGFLVRRRPGKRQTFCIQRAAAAALAFSRRKKGARKLCRAHRNAIFGDERPGKIRELMGEIIVMKCHRPFVNNATGAINLHASNFICKIVACERRDKYAIIYLPLIT